ncbi:hypothetical protein JTB14_016698 [Gonioctena quinquepunctata]|nr:hypothetical protein JTB14_016698 [Gonioctena quinquepunctata]
MDTSTKAFPSSVNEESFKRKQRKLRTSGQAYPVGTKKKGYEQLPAKDPDGVNTRSSALETFVIDLQGTAGLLSVTVRLVVLCPVSGYLRIAFQAT